MTISIKAWCLRLVVLTAFIGMLWLLWQLQALLVVVFVAFTLSSALLPTVELLERRKLPPWLAVVVPFVLLLIFALVLVLPLTMLMIDQLQALANHLPNYWSQGQAQMDGFSRQADLWHEQFGRKFPFLLKALGDWPPDRLLQQSSGMAFNLVNGFTGATLAMSRLLTDSLTVCLFSFLILMDRHRIVNYVLSFVDLSQHTQCRDLVHQLCRGVGGYVNGQIILMLISGLMTTIGLTLVGFPFALLFGVVTGLAFAIPVFGPILVLLPAVLLAWVSPHGASQAISVLTVYLVVMALHGNVLGPWVLSRVIGLHPLAILLAIMAGGSLCGLQGILLAIPVVTCCNILLMVSRHWNKAEVSSSS